MSRTAAEYANEPSIESRQSGILTDYPCLLNGKALPVNSSTLIPGLHGSAMHEMSILLYRRHHDGGNGMCAECDYRSPCPARRHAMIVIMAAGDRPDQYNAKPSTGPVPLQSGAADWTTERAEEIPFIDESSADRTGYRFGGRNRTVSPDDAGYLYDRYL